MQKLSGLFLFAILISGAFSSSFAFTQVGPIAVDDFYSVDEDSLLTINSIGVLQNDTNTQNSNTFLAIIQTSTGFGTITLNSDGSFTYQPNANFASTDSFTYVANNGTDSSNEATVTLTVNPINDAPTASNDSYTISEDSTLVIVAPGVIDNDSDVDEDSLSSLIDTSTNNGILVLNSDGSFTYTPNANFVGSDSFTYHVNDGTLDSNIVTVDITVSSENDAPVAQDDSYTISEDSTLVIVAPGVIDNDSDVDEDSLSSLIDTSTNNGILVLNSDGSFTYTPNANFVGSDSFTYHVNDGTLDSNIVTVDITVSSENDAPVAQDDQAETQQNVPVLIDVLENDFDVEDDSLNVLLIVDPLQTKGTVELDDAKVLFTPNLDFVGDTTFSYVVSDGDKTSNLAQVTVTVTVVDDPDDSIFDQILEQIQSLLDKILNIESEITLLKDENSALAMRITELESIVANGLTTNDDDDDNEKILVCHKNKKTISISENGLSGHLKHGDSIGECTYNDDEISSEKEIKNQIKELKKDFKAQEKALKNDFKAQEKDLEKQLEELKKD
ncbi:MAG: Ig-like domain-containing protein [Nitrosopumilus sp.]